VLVDPIKPNLKRPDAKRLKLKSDEPLSDFAFSFNLRRYSKAEFEISKEKMEEKVEKRVTKQKEEHAVRVAKVRRQIDPRLPSD